MNKRNFTILFVYVLFILMFLTGCIANEKLVKVNIKSSHTWALDIEVNFKVWDEGSSDESTYFNYSEARKFYINENDFY